MVVFNHLIMKSFMTFKKRSYSLTVLSTVILFLTGGCILLSPPGPNVTASHSSADLTGSHLRLELNQEYMVVSTNGLNPSDSVTNSRTSSP